MRRWPAIPMAAVVALAVGAALFANVGVRRTSASPQAAVTPFQVVLDCDPGTAGIQSSCPFPLGTTSVNVDVVFQNISGPPTTSLGSLQFDVITNQQAIFNPAIGVDTNLNGNPDFNQAAVTGTWSCGPPPPARDTNADPAIADSLLSCFNSAADGPTVATGASIVLGTVHYISVDGSGSFALANVAVFDAGLTELMTCNPVSQFEGNCFGASVQIGANTPTPTGTAVNTPLPTTPTNTPIAGSPTSEAFITVTPTGTPATATPIAGSQTAVPTATLAGGAPPPPPPPPTGNQPGGGAGAGGSVPIRLPDTGSGGASTDWSSVSLIALAALAAGVLAGGLYFGVAQVASVRRRDGED